ncbi:hypothetical protein ACI2OX_16820 [Bacillus sp. N9]
MKKYDDGKKQKYKNIDASYEFQLSLYQNDLFTYEKDGEIIERVFRGDNSPRENRIEVEYIFKRSKNQIKLSPSTISNVVKYNVDVLGNRHKIQKEKFKSYLQM